MNAEKVGCYKISLFCSYLLSSNIILAVFLLLIGSKNDLGEKKWENKNIKYYIIIE